MEAVAGDGDAVRDGAVDDDEQADDLEDARVDEHDHGRDHQDPESPHAPAVLQPFLTGARPVAQDEADERDHPKEYERSQGGDGDRSVGRSRTRVGRDELVVGRVAPWCRRQCKRDGGGPHRDRGRPRCPAPPRRRQAAGREEDDHVGREDEERRDPGPQRRLESERGDRVERRRGDGHFLRLDVGVRDALDGETGGGAGGLQRPEHHGPQDRPHGSVARLAPQAEQDHRAEGKRGHDVVDGPVPEQPRRFADR